MAIIGVIVSIVAVFIYYASITDIAEAAAYSGGSGSILVSSLSLILVFIAGNIPLLINMNLNKMAW